MSASGSNSPAPEGRRLPRRAARSGSQARRSPRQRLSRIARAMVLAPIIVYRTVVSPALPRRCKYEPTCSRYAIEAIREYGILRGLVLAGWRLLRCNPWSHGGYDPVEAQRVFAIGSRTSV